MVVEEIYARLQRPPLVVEPITDFAELDVAVLILRCCPPFVIHLGIPEHTRHDVVVQVDCQSSAWVTVGEIGQRPPSFEHQAQVHLGQRLGVFDQDITPRHIAVAYVLDELVSGLQGVRTGQEGNQSQRFKNTPG